MPEELRVVRTVESGFVDTGRPGRTGLDSLSEALGRFGRVAEGAVNLAAREAQREEREVEEALASPLITEDEVREIEQGATFPLAKFRAQNRRGELFVQRELEDIQDEIAKAPDVITARQLLRDRQRRLLEEHAGEDAAVLAGIRERFAREGQPLLAEASKRRILDREREENLNVDEDLRLSLEHGGPVGYVNSLIPVVNDEALTAGDVTARLERAAIVLENFWREGDDESGDNVNADDAMEAIDLALELPLDAPQRKVFNKLRDTIQSGEEARRRVGAETGAQAQDRINAAVFQRILEFQEANPNSPVLPEDRQALIATARTAEKKEARRKWLDENALPNGVLDTDEWQQGLNRLRAQQASFFDSEAGIAAGALGLVTLNDTIAIYEAIGATADPQFAKDPTSLRQMREQALADAPLMAEERAKKRAERAERLEQRRAEVSDAYTKLVNQGKPDKAEELLQNSQAELRAEIAAETQQSITRWLLRNGYGRFDFVNPLE